MPPRDSADDVAADLLALMPRDLIFVPRFLGESQERMQRHFRDFARTELAARGMTAETHPLLPAFVDRHAAVLSEFVFVGVSLPYQIPIAEVERIMSDHHSLLRSDLWDQIKQHVTAAEARFRQEMPELATLLAALQPEDNSQPLGGKR